LSFVSPPLCFFTSAFLIPVVILTCSGPYGVVLYYFLPSFSVWSPMFRDPIFCLPRDLLFSAFPPLFLGLVRSPPSDWQGFQDGLCFHPFPLTSVLFSSSSLPGGRFSLILIPPSSGLSHEAFPTVFFFCRRPLLPIDWGVSFALPSNRCFAC